MGQEHSCLRSIKSSDTRRCTDPNERTEPKESKDFHELVDFKKRLDFNKRKGSKKNTDRNKSIDPRLVVDAVLNQDVRNLERLLLHEESHVNFVDEQGQTLLHYSLDNSTPYACVCVADDPSAESKQVVMLLLAKGVNVNSQNKKGQTPLHLVESPELLQILLENNADVNIPDERGTTPLHLAILRKNTQICEMLLSEGADVNAENILGFSALSIATRMSYLEGTKLLLENDAHVNLADEAGQTALHVSICNRNIEITKLLLIHGANVNAQKKPSGLFRSSATEFSTKWRLRASLIQVYQANFQKTLYDFVTFVSNYAELTHESECCIGSAPLHSAVLFVEGLKLLLEYGAEVNLRDDMGRTALHIAFLLIDEIDENCFSILLENGSDINITTNDTLHLTPIHCFIGVSDPYSPYVSCLHDHLNVQKTRIKIKKVDEIIKQHYFKMKAANFHISDENLSLFTDQAQKNAFEKECECEIAKLVSQNVGVSNYTFYDILTAQENDKLMAYALNKNIIEGLLKWQDSYMFSKYGNMIACNVRKIMLLYEAREAFCKNVIDVPSLCIDKIFYYLSYHDLMVFIAACQLK